MATRALAVAFAALALLAGPGANSAPAETGAGRIAARDGRLTVRVDAVRAEWVLPEIARLTGIRISASRAVLERPVTADLADVEIEAALSRLLAGLDYVLVFGPTVNAGSGAQPVLTEVRVFSHRAKAAAAPAALPATSPEITALLNGLADPDPDVRIASIEALGRSGPGVPAERVLAAGLGDRDPRGRIAVLTSGLTIPRDVLVDRAMYDDSPAVRAEALTQLPRNDPRAEAVARAALADPDETVRAMARDLLAALPGQSGRR